MAAVWHPRRLVRRLGWPGPGVPAAGSFGFKLGAIPNLRVRMTRIRRATCRLGWIREGTARRRARTMMTRMPERGSAA